MPRQLEVGGDDRPGKPRKETSTSLLQRIRASSTGNRFRYAKSAGSGDRGRNMNLTAESQPVRVADGCSWSTPRKSGGPQRGAAPAMLKVSLISSATLSVGAPGLMPKSARFTVNVERMTSRSPFMLGTRWPSLSFR